MKKGQGSIQGVPKNELNVAPLHLDGETHTWEGRWIAKNPRGDFRNFAYALTQRKIIKWDEPYDV
jgi:hypothetical protein